MFCLGIRLITGGRYRSIGGELIEIKCTINKHHPEHRLGFRFVDKDGRTYKADGKWTTDMRNTVHDLVEEID